MKYPHLWILAGMFLATACKKDTETQQPATTTTYSADVNITFPQLGTGEMAAIYAKKAPLFTISGNYKNQAYVATITGADTTARIAAITSSTGIDTIYFVTMDAMRSFKDGTLQLTVEIGDTTIVKTFEKEEFIIRDYRDFMGMGFYDGTHASDVFVQAQDFAFPDTVFTTCPSAETWSLYGTYDGQGHKITNLTMAYDEATGTDQKSLALFRFAVSGAVIKNVNLEYSSAGVKIGSASNNVQVAGLIGFADYSTIMNCSVKGDFTFAGGGYASGLVIRMYEGKIIGSSYTGSVTNADFSGLAYTFSGAINMSYAAFDYAGTSAAGLVNNVSQVYLGTGGSIANSYAYINTSVDTTAVHAIVPASSLVTVSNTFANYGSKKLAGITLYPALADLNTALTALTVSDWPEQETTTATGNKPFVGNGDASAKLWWQ